jgi:hypothetical protein
LLLIVVTSCLITNQIFQANGYHEFLLDEERPLIEFDYIRKCILRGESNIRLGFVRPESMYAETAESMREDYASITQEVCQLIAPL